MPDLSNIAQVDRLLNVAEVACFCTLLSRPVVSMVVKAEVERYRQKVRQKACEVSTDELLETIVDALAYQCAQRIQPVINATGILVHTNFGRSPLPRKVWDEAAEVVCRYSNLEMNLASGKRGNRMGNLPFLLQAYFGGESSLLVNNNAAAMHLLLRTLAAGKEVVVSRGEQVQIGGGFRIPEILAESGAILRDVGTTNITTVDDYLNAVNENTAMVLVVHQSNYYIEGFTKRVDVKVLASRLPPGVLLVVDQGSGNIHAGIAGEPSVSSYLRAGAHLVCFSTDKMLGGPQGGVIIGQKEWVAKLAKHPMMRAFRPGKETYALLERLFLHRLNQGGVAQDRVAQILAEPLTWHEERARRIAAINPHLLEVVPAKYLIGGGTTPRAQYDTWAVKLAGNFSAAVWLKMLREHTPPIMGIAQQDQVLLYPVTLFDDELDVVMDAIKKIYSSAEMAKT